MQRSFDPSGVVHELRPGRARRGWLLSAHGVVAAALACAGLAAGVVIALWT